MARPIKTENLSREELIFYGIKKQRMMARDRLNSMKRYYSWTKNKYSREYTKMLKSLSELSDDDLIKLGEKYVVMRTHDKKGHKRKYAENPEYRLSRILAYRKKRGLAYSQEIADYKPHRKVSNV